jgi:hypothetical protein
MTFGFTLFSFIFGLNLMVILFSGVDRLLSVGSGLLAGRDWLVTGVLTLLFGWTAFGLQRLSALIPGGGAFFLPLAAGVFILVRAGLKNIRERSADRSADSGDALVGLLDRLTQTPALAIPVLLVGYHHWTAAEVLFILVSSWAGSGVALVILTALKKHLALESEAAIKRQELLLLSVGIAAMIFAMIDRGFWSVFAG